MIWKPTLISFLVGIMIGVVAMRFGNRKLRHQQNLQNELEKSKAEINQNNQELNSYFARSAELLNNMANSYQQLYQHIANSSHSLLSDDQRNKDNPFRYRLTEADNDQIPAEIQPWHKYSKTTNKLQQSSYAEHKK
ncbi:ZapG family protein [Candidatus Palibaumannia cicadellinicola]|uniref:Z-ring associated protein G n=1 Tax=Baumannia cicadellinicola subsp. Homalodisca coagulata TaxID=374463 RepID=Q1LU55_BAUCH|nr:DUF1043 family protein [Candidatus Baumannia cicadellinicola]ABF14070.1 conserved hypothetical protein [Baumannia cicadellinicola str. Hc (Homalodisca coagulata)]MBS0032576.1 DUF1043 family protein [Candidatus Baumannia cicadellinicola]MCJ7462018.1 DUF1043 family protein [Candidatus Baumannia cicadellinicola]MCJ7462567.1 DUF1043 family protein [Candidatus Baumannia cicadellinicola]